MGIEATTSSVSSSSQAPQVSTSASADSSKKTSTDSSFKDEMSKVSKESDKDTVKDKAGNKNASNNTAKSENKDDDNSLLGTSDYSNYGTLALNDANAMLSNDIMRMMNTNNYLQVDRLHTGSIFGFDAAETKNSVFFTKSDAEFFITLTQTDISSQNALIQAQMMFEQGVDAQELTQNMKISQTLLNAINTAKENNQPLRIDFDQNVSVILRIGRDGVISANFIPGDKAVEQYLRNNIDSLKATFEENDLPYSDLSYSNSSKRENQKRRNQQQGE